MVDGSSFKFESMSILPDFERVSIQMIRLGDILESKGESAVNYEKKAFSEFRDRL